MTKLDSILLIEDDAIDAMTVKRALKDIKTTVKLEVVKNGEEALELLREKDRQPPSLILLDINMPKMNGIEFLKEIKKDSKLRIIPVVILTTSREDNDKSDTYDLGICGYIIKPVEYGKFVEIMSTIEKYWQINVLPEFQ